MADRETPHTILTRIEGLIRDLKTTSPSGAETMHAKLTAEIALMRDSLDGEKPEPAPERQASPLVPPPNPGTPPAPLG